MLGQLVWLLFASLATGQLRFPPFQGGQCQCNKTSAWLDVVIVFEGTTQNRYSYLTSIADFTTRIGTVVYADNATILGALGTVSQDVLNGYGFGNEYTVSNGNKTNLAAGLKLAVEQFNTAGRRPNVPKIILLMSSFYNPLGVESPMGIAEEFKASGGIIINYKMTSLFGDDTFEIQRMASPGYELSDSDGLDGDAVDEALCQANCFCPRGYSSYKSNLRGLPVAGCYSPVTTPATYAAAVETCRQQGGIVASGENSPKMYYLNSLLSGYMAPPVAHRAYIGLTLDLATGNWTWSDGIPMSRPQWRCRSCTMSSDYSCAYMQVSQVDSYEPFGFWDPTRCDVAYPFVCELAPCDSVNYCPWKY